jgi:hypothetical protein
MFIGLNNGRASEPSMSTGNERRVSATLFNTFVDINGITDEQSK